MLHEKIESALKQVELQSEAVALALETGESAALETAAATLREAVLLFSQFAPHISPADREDVLLKLRLKRLAASLASHREGLVRRSVMVDRALDTLLPAATESATYNKTTGPYGARGRQSKAFNVLKA